MCTELHAIAWHLRSTSGVVPTQCQDLSLRSFPCLLLCSLPFLFLSSPMMLRVRNPESSIQQVGRGGERQAPRNYTRHRSELELQPSQWLSEGRPSMHCFLFFQAPGISPAEEKGAKFVFYPSPPSISAFKWAQVRTV